MDIKEWASYLEISKEFFLKKVEIDEKGNLFYRIKKPKHVIQILEILFANNREKKIWMEYHLQGGNFVQRFYIEQYQKENDFFVCNGGSFRFKPTLREFGTMVGSGTFQYEKNIIVIKYANDAGEGSREVFTFYFDFAENFLM